MQAQGSFGSACERPEHHQVSCPRHSIQQPEKLPNVTYGTLVASSEDLWLQQQNDASTGFLRKRVRKTRALSGFVSKPCKTEKLPTLYLRNALKSLSPAAKTLGSTNEMMQGSCKSAWLRPDHHQASLPRHAKQQPEKLPNVTYGTR